MGCGCEGKNPAGQLFSQAVLWFDGKYLSMVNTDTLYLPADQWLDTRQWMECFILLEFHGSGGSSLTVTLETATAMTTDNSAWQTVTSASAAMSATAKVLQGSRALTIPPKGLIRLKFAASGNVTGVVRAQVVFKRGT
jgi:hypothetical protein